MKNYNKPLFVIDKGFGDAFVFDVTCGKNKYECVRPLIKIVYKIRGGG